MNDRFSRMAALKAAALMAASTYVTVGLGLVVSAVIARGLGPTDYGHYAYMLWLSGLLVVLCNHGLGASGMRFISESLGRGDTNAAADLHGWLWVRQWWSIAAVLLVFIAAFPWVQPADWEGQTTLLVAVLVVSVTTKAVFLFKVNVAKGYGMFHVEAWATMAMSLLYTTGIIALTWMSATLTSYLIFFALVSAAHVVATAPMLRKGGAKRGRGQNDPALLARVKAHMGWTSLQVGVAVLSNKTMETVLLNTYAGPAEVGFFTIAANLSRGGIELVASSLTTILMPAMAHAYGAGGLQQVNVILSDAIRYCMFLGLVVAGLGMAWAGPGVIMMYGQDYEQVIFVLRVMVLVGGATLAEAAFGALLSVTDNQRIRAFMAILSVITSMTAAWLLIPRHGLTGAVAAFALTRTLIFALTAVLSVKMLTVRLPTREMGRLMAAAALAGVAGGAVAFVGRGHVIAQLLAGPVYLMALLTLSAWFACWRHKDVALLATLLNKKPALTGRIAPAVERWAASLEKSEQKAASA